jgi:hypothetical protein
MSRVEQIEGQIRALSSEELQALRAWFAEFDAGLWDRQFESDVSTGKLDELAEQALKDHVEGRCREL